MNYSVEICLTMAISKDYSTILALPLGHLLQFFSLALVAAGLFLSYFLTPLFCAQQVLPFLKYVITEVPLNVTDEFSFVQWWVHLAVIWKCLCLCPTWEQLLASSHRSHICIWILLLSIGKIAVSFNMLKQQPDIYSTARFLFWWRCKLFPSFSLKLIPLANTKTWTWPKCYIVAYQRVKRVSSGFNLILNFHFKSLFFITS